MSEADSLLQSDHFIEVDDNAQQYKDHYADAMARQEGVEQIHQDVTDINEMFQDLSTLVESQQQFVDTIESNLTDSKDKAKGAHDELQKASAYQQTGRKRTCKMITVAAATLGALVLGFVIF